MQYTHYLQTLAGRYAPFLAQTAAAEPQNQAVVAHCRDVNGCRLAYTLGYEEKLVLGPWYASEGDGVYEHLKFLLEHRLTMDGLRSALLTVAPDGSALRREVCIEITGAKEGRIGFCLHFTGRQSRGRFEEGRFFGSYAGTGF